jgi:hypothetical protein
MLEKRARLSGYESRPSAAAAGEDFQGRLRHPKRYDTFPLFTGGLRGSFRFSARLASRPQRFSSTAVYPPCPPWSSVNSGACAPGHGGYTASGYPATPGNGDRLFRPWPRPIPQQSAPASRRSPPTPCTSAGLSAAAYDPLQREAFLARRRAENAFFVGAQG